MTKTPIKGTVLTFAMYIIFALVLGVFTLWAAGMVGDVVTAIRKLQIDAGMPLWHVSEAFNTADSLYQSLIKMAVLLFAIAASVLAAGLSVWLYELIADKRARRG